MKDRRLSINTQLPISFKFCSVLHSISGISQQNWVLLVQRSNQFINIPFALIYSLLFFLNLWLWILGFISQINDLYSNPFLKVCSCRNSNQECCERLIPLRTRDRTKQKFFLCCFLDFCFLYRPYLSSMSFTENPFSPLWPVVPLLSTYNYVFFWDDYSIPLMYLSIPASVLNIHIC